MASEDAAATAQVRDKGNWTRVAAVKMDSSGGTQEPWDMKLTRLWDGLDMGARERVSQGDLPGVQLHKWINRGTLPEMGNAGGDANWVSWGGKVMSPAVDMAESEIPLRQPLETLKRQVSIQVPKGNTWTSLVL